MPYIYSLAGHAWLESKIMMRGLVMDFSEDSVARDISDQYMFGPSLMVCPVYEYGATARNVYLPEGKQWYDYYTEYIYSGGQTIEAEAPYERIPLFVPAGAILVSGKDVNYVDERPADELTFDFYSGSDGQFQLYEDDGTTNAYQEGAFSVIPVSFKEDEYRCVFTFDKRVGEYDGMVTKRKFNIRYHMPDRIIERTVEYSGNRLDYDLRLR